MEQVVQFLLERYKYSSQNPRNLSEKDRLFYTSIQELEHTSKDEIPNLFYDDSGYLLDPVSKYKKDQESMFCIWKYPIVICESSCFLFLSRLAG